MIPANPALASEDQLVAYLDQQIAALKTRLETTDKILLACEQGIACLKQAPEPSLANVGEVTSRLIQGLGFLLQSNLIANRLNRAEMDQQMDQLEKTRQQHTAKIHLGGFVPRLRST
jgi:hypothetical protein